MHLPSLGRLAWQSLFLASVAVLSITTPTGAQNPQDPDPDRHIVKFRDEARGRAALAAAGGQVVLDLPSVAAAAARIPAQALEGLRNHPAIEYIEPDAPRYPYGQTTPYGISMVQADQVGDAAASGRTVCIIDSGYDLGHPDLPMSNVTGAAGNLNPLQDGCSHGTHVAGTIAAVANNLGVVGVMPNERINLHIVRVFGDSCSWAYSSTLITAAQRCADANANVISMSLGGTTSSTTERNAFASHYANGILPVAAAGNDGTTRLSYPASYDSVISVAAVDSAEVAASFSQRNSQVELAAPGVAVRSTVKRGTGKEESLTVGSGGYEVIAFEGSPNLSRTGTLVDCGLGTSVCSSASGGKVCLIARGTNSFAEKVLNCQNGGGSAAVIYNNAAALFSGTLGSTTTTIPSVGASGTTGAALKAVLGQSATVAVQPGDYAFYDGTSMATPHVSAVATLIWSHKPAATNAEVRAALAATAKDLGSTGRDSTYGYGLIRAKAALDYLLAGAPPPPPPPPPTGIVLSATKSKVKGVNQANLSWQNATGAVDVFRNGEQLTTVSGSTFVDNTGSKGGASYQYQVCLTGTSTCSNVVTVTF